MSGTTVSLLDRVASGTFSDRLFYRLNTIHLVVPNGDSWTRIHRSLREHQSFGGRPGERAHPRYALRSGDLGLCKPEQTDPSRLARLPTGTIVSRMCFRS